MKKKLDSKALLARAEDTAELCEKQYSPKAFGFLTPADAAVIRQNFAKKNLGADISFKFFGGYPDAERSLFLVYPDYAEDTVDEEFIALVEITGRDISTLCHRDFLGSLLGLGLKREKLGDILCLEDRTLVFAAKDIAGYIVSNLDMVARVGVKARVLELGKAQIPKRQFDEIRTTVASLRLDSVVGAALKTSRSAAAEAIRAKRVLVNWQECMDISAKISPGDVFSVRGAGRFRLSEDIKTTRKDRLGICIEKAK
ncbi:MAG: hypothetical protein IJE62_01625 [Clostridia bacterium]|nr:hypothetical protein [Clostridia bacterium]